MKDLFPKEIATLHGIALVSRMATLRNAELGKQTPDVDDIISKLDRDTQQKAIQLYNPMDVEIAGYEDATSKWMTDGFLEWDKVDIIDREIIDIGGRPGIDIGWPPPPPPPPPVPCDQLNARLGETLRELFIQQSLASALEQLLRDVSAMRGWFVEPIRRAIERLLAMINARIDNLRRDFALTRAAADAQGCEIMLPFPGRVLR